MRNPLLNWLFYGHLWIALAALALSWQSTYLATGDPALYASHYFVFFATLGVYTSHRALSFQRTRGYPTGRRYRLISRQPVASALVAILSLTVAAAIATQFAAAAFWPVILALPFTFFYLIPLFPGGPRLRDLPYLKVVWVALAWALMTDTFVAEGVRSVGSESFIRFALILAVALLFDSRDVVLDRRQGVRTLAAQRPGLNRSVAMLLLLGCGLLSYLSYPTAQGLPLLLAYAAAALVGRFTRADRGEDFYAVYVNGLLLLPPLCLLLGLLS
ncbi:hypothetical protein LEM8419_00910 [Neolewinella maritima]|uniref:Prenyltransferase n=1 Tax=Neolewinella maritima TaxID=1383882 RepID=A0ABM9AYF3_9BACT|nr:hypothetical protein [Neolewinella maritima]CAH0999610.1 hypothetical protein LEM8419_00910 [Neolewinella maritima]